MSSSPWLEAGVPTRVLVAVGLCTVALAGCRDSSSSSTSKPELGSTPHEDAAPSPPTDAELAALAEQAISSLEALGQAKDLLPDCDAVAANWTRLFEQHKQSRMQVYRWQGEASVADRLDTAFDALSARSRVALEDLASISAACETSEKLISAREHFDAILR